MVLIVMMPRTHSLILIVLNELIVVKIIAKFAFKQLAWLEEGYYSLLIPIGMKTQELSQQGGRNVMKEENITRVTLDPNNPSKGKTDWEQVDAMTEEEIHAAALSDPDAQPVTPEELEEFKPVPDAKVIREEMNLTQKEFASRFQLSLRTLQDWETGQLEPDPAAKALLPIIVHSPELVEKVLSGENPTH